MKVEIDFPSSFDSKDVSCLPLGRICLGEHVGRLVFTPEGRMVLVIDKGAIEDGSIVFVDTVQYEKSIRLQVFKDGFSERGN